MTAAHAGLQVDARHRRPADASRVLFAAPGGVNLEPSWRLWSRSPVRARRGVDWGYADLVDGEIAQAIDALRARCPESPLYALGHSLGGHALLLHQARRADQALAGVVLVASGTPWWRT